jgi:hypothetical protein
MKFVLPLMLALVVSSYVSAADAPAAKEESWTGKLAEKGKDAKEGVVACLKVDEKTTVCLSTKDAELAKKLVEGAAKGAEVKITGTKSEAGVAVTKCDAVEAKKDAPKADAPKADAPKADAPKTDAPKADAPKGH